MRTLTLASALVGLAGLSALAGCAQAEQLARDAIAGYANRPAPATDDTPRDYRTSQGAAIRFPLGAVAFADRVERFDQTRSISETYSDPWSAVGPPDYSGNAECTRPNCSTTLTSGGVLVVEFTNNTLYDGPGDDIAIFEVGPDIESTTVEISVDGRDYIALGTVRGSSATLDIAGRGPTGAQYRFVRLTDDPTQGDAGGTTPGADIDAVGAIHAEKR